MKRLSIFIYRLLEYYDKALFKLALPLIAPLFFPSLSPTASLMWGYLLIPITTLSRPIGSLFFGHMSESLGVKRTFSIASFGLGLATLMIAFVPSFAYIGLLSPILLALCRLAQNLCIAGQTTGGALILMETSKKKRNFASSLYESIAEIGALLAAGGLALIAYFNLEKELWRLLFVLGSSIGLFAFSSIKFQKKDLKPQPKKYAHTLKRMLKQERYPLMLGAIFSGFAYGNYALIQALFTGLLPLESTLSYAFAMQLCYAATLLDILLLPVMGKLCDRFGKESISFIASSLLVLLAPGLIYYLPEGGPVYAGCVYTSLLTLCTALVAPFYHWLWRLAPQKSAYTFIAFAKAIGLQVIGAPMASLAIFLYRTWGSFLGPGCLMALLGLMQLAVVVAASKHLKVQVLKGE